MQVPNYQVKDVQRIALDILENFITVCNKLGLKYYLIAGTLLGAVRHNGFIPWDDDIDVGLMREDYEVFLKSAQEYLPEYLFLQTYETDSGYYQPYAKIRNSQTTFIETSVKDKMMNHGIFIDVFPLDNCCANYINSKIFKAKQMLMRLRISKVYSNNKLSKKASLIRRITPVIYPNVKRTLFKLDKLYKESSSGNCVVNYSGYGVKEIMPREWYGDGLEFDFENIKVVVPSQYHNVLTQIYGNYMEMPPEGERKSNHFTEFIDVNKSYIDYINGEKSKS